MTALVALRPEFVVAVCSAASPTPYGNCVVWWVEHDGEPCCSSPELYRHIAREDAIWHGRAKLANGRWKA